MDDNIAKKIEELIKEGYKRKQISSILGITENQYKYYQQKYKLNTLNKSNDDKPYMKKEWLEEMYKRYNSATKIGEICNAKAKTITYWRKKLGIQKCDMSSNAKRYKANYNFFESIDSEEKAYWLGFIVADGCVDIKGKNAIRLSISLSSIDRNHLKKFLKSIESTNIIYDASYVNNITGKISNKSTVTIYNKKICNDLIKHGCGIAKTGKEKFPDSIPDELKKHFIRGFFDGDGCISYYNSRNNYSFELCSASLEMIQSISQVLETKINCEIKFNKDNSGKYSVDFYTIKIMNIKKNLAIYKYLYKDSSIYLNRKYDRVEDFLNKYCPPKQ